MFHSGITETPIKKRGRSKARLGARTARTARKARAKTHSSFLKSSITFSFIPKRPLWYIIPEFATPIFMQRTFIKYSRSLPEAWEFLKSHKKMQLSYFRMSATDYAFSKTLLLKNLKMRFFLQKFLKIWIYKRLKLANTEDPITFEKPRQQVEVVEWGSKRRYIFEAKTLFHYILCQLAHQDFLFPMCISPRNVFTNENFKKEQLESIYLQLQPLHYSHWIWEAFADTKFNVSKFKILYDKPLRNYILEEVFKKKTSHELIDILLDFIESEAEIHNIYSGIPYRTLRWAFEHLPNYRYIVDWRNTCLKFYRMTTINEYPAILLYIRYDTKKLLDNKQIFVELNKEQSRFINSKK
jgi:hypothetical protein